MPMDKEQDLASMLYDSKKQTDSGSYELKKKKPDEAIKEVQEYLSKEYRTFYNNSISDQYSADQVRYAIKNYVNDKALLVEGYDKLDEVVNFLSDEVTGFGVINKYLKEKEGKINEIQVNGPEEIRIDTPNGNILTDDRFASLDQAINITKRLLRIAQVVINEGNPRADASLPDGTRIKAVIKPVALRGISLIIRKQNTRSFSREEYIDFGTLSEEELNFLELMVKGGCTIAFVGPTFSGKTALMKHCCTNYLPADERIITIENPPELNLLKLDDKNRPQNHIVPWEVRDNLGATLSNLIKDALRASPQRIIIGEVRGEEAMDLLEAIRTGHPSMFSYHAEMDEPITRFLTMCKQSKTDLSEDLLLQMISRAIDFIVYIEKLKDHSRKVLSIREVLGYKDKEVQYNEIFKFEINDEKEDEDTVTIKGRHKQVGYISERIKDKLLLHGIKRRQIAAYLKD